MTDRELLELAAKAAGYKVHTSLMEQRAIASPDAIALALSDPGNTWWNPLEDDGDALRLAVALGIAVVPYPIYARPKHSVIAKQYNHLAALRGEGQDINIEEIQVYSSDPNAATRRAITRAAAEIQRQREASK